MRAKDLMIPLRNYLKADNSIREAVNLLQTAVKCDDKVDVKSLPVLDSEGKLVGILSMQDILKAVYPAYMSMMNLGHFTWDGMLESLAKHAGDKRVEELMSREIVTVEDEDPLMECVDLMLKHDVQLLPVLNRAGKLSGMLYERDVFFAITRFMQEDNNGGGQ